MLTRGQVDGGDIDHRVVVARLPRRGADEAAVDQHVQRAVDIAGEPQLVAAGPLHDEAAFDAPGTGERQLRATLEIGRDLDLRGVRGARKVHRDVARARDEREVGVRACGASREDSQAFAGGDRRGFEAGSEGHVDERRGTDAAPDGVEAALPLEGEVAGRTAPRGRAAQHERAESLDASQRERVGVIAVPVKLRHPSHQREGAGVGEAGLVHFRVAQQIEVVFVEVPGRASGPVPAKRVPIFASSS